MSGQVLAFAAWVFVSFLVVALLVIVARMIWAAIESGKDEL